MKYIILILLIGCGSQTYPMPSTLLNNTDECYKRTFRLYDIERTQEGFFYRVTEEWSCWTDENEPDDILK